MGRRTLLLIASALVAALGTTLIWLYVNGADRRALGRQRLVPVWVATTNIPPRTSATIALHNFARQEQLPARLAEGAVSDLGAIATLVTTGPIARGSLIRTESFAASAPVSSSIAPSASHYGVTVSLANPAKVTSLTRGMTVAVFVTGSRSAGAGGEAAGTRLLIPSVSVLDVGGAALGGAARAAAVPETMVTLDLTPQQARTVIQIQAAQAGQLWFALIGAGLTDGADTSARTTTEDVFPQ